MVSLLSFFVRFGSWKESSGGICRRSSLTGYNVLDGRVMFQPLFSHSMLYSLVITALSVPMGVKRVLS